MATTNDVASWVATIDNDARVWRDVLMPGENRELRHICVLPVFLSRWFGISPATASELVAAAVREGKIELDADGEAARPKNAPLYHALFDAETGEAPPGLSSAS